MNTEERIKLALEEAARHVVLIPKERLQKENTHAALCPYKENWRYNQCCPDDRWQIPPDGDLTKVYAKKGFYASQCKRTDCPFYNNNEPVWDFPDWDRIDMAAWGKWHPAGAQDASYEAWFTGTGVFRNDNCVDFVKDGTMKGGDQNG
jgi:hypothetical protein